MRGLSGGFTTDGAKAPGAAPFTKIGLVISGVGKSTHTDSSTSLQSSKAWTLGKMTLYPNQNSNQTCLCRESVVRIPRSIRSPELDIALILDLVEEVTSSFARSSHGSCGCLQLSDYVQMLLDTTNSLFDILDATWKNAFLDRNTHLRAPVMIKVALSPDGNNERQFASTTITGLQNIATVDRFILDELEKKLVLEEILRGSLMSINHIVRGLHHQIIQQGKSDSWPLECKKRMNAQSITLLERTYSALARYGGSSELNG